MVIKFTKSRKCRATFFKFTAEVGTLAAGVLETVVHINGTQAAPVTNVTFAGLEFSQTATAFLKPCVNVVRCDSCLVRTKKILTVRVMSGVELAFTDGQGRNDAHTRLGAMETHCCCGI